MQSQKINCNLSLKEISKLVAVAKSVGRRRHCEFLVNDYSVMVISPYLNYRQILSWFRKVEPRFDDHYGLFKCKHKGLYGLVSLIEV